MSRRMTTFEEWHAEQMKDPEFVAEKRKLEPGYQITRLRIERGLTQAQLAELAGTRQPAIARLESGASSPSLSFLERVARALDAEVQIKVVRKKGNSD